MLGYMCVPVEARDMGSPKAGDTVVAMNSLIWRLGTEHGSSGRAACSNY